MIVETHKYESLNGVAVTVHPRNMEGQRFSDGHQNAQVSCLNLNGGSFTVSYRPIGSSQFIEHVTGATETDSVLLSGDRAPVFEALKITFNGVANTTAQVIVNTWARGI